MAGDVWQALHWFSLKEGPRPSAGLNTRLNSAAPARNRASSAAPRPGSGAPGSPVAARPPQAAAPTTTNSQSSRAFVTPAAGPDDDHPALGRCARPTEADRHFGGAAVHLDGLDVLGLNHVIQRNLRTLDPRDRRLCGLFWSAEHIEPPASGVAADDHDSVHEHPRVAWAAVREK